jgi:hypothetical protein
VDRCSADEIDLRPCNGRAQRTGLISESMQLESMAARVCQSLTRSCRWLWEPTTEPSPVKRRGGISNQEPEGSIVAAAAQCPPLPPGVVCCHEGSG